MFKSIKTRLTVTICGILFILFLIQMAANFLLAEKYYVYQKTKMMMEVNRQIHEQAESAENDISFAIRGIAMDNSLEILLADENFNMIFSNHAMGPPMDPRMMDINFDFKRYPKEYYKTDEPTIIKTDMKNGDRIRLLSKIVQGDRTYYLVIRLSVKSLSSDMKSTNIFVLYISSFAILIGSLIVYFIAKHFSKPIEDINAVTVRISNLDFSLRSKDIKRKDEIGSLARNINTMSDRLKDNILGLQEANKKLEMDNKYMSEVDEQRKELIANISHELKTPLAILTGYTEILSNDIPGIDKAFYFETIQDETRKMDVLIKNLLNLSDFENRLFHLNIQEIDIDKLTERIYRKNKLLMDNKGIISEYHPMSSSTPLDIPNGMSSGMPSVIPSGIPSVIPSGIPSVIPSGIPDEMPYTTVLADPMYLEVALNNYIANAISYTEKGLRIIIKAEQIEDEAVISVFNEGVGISEEHMDKIWNSFYREDKSRKRTSQNNIGLGLYIVRSIMNAQHGRYGVLNKDNGVEFWLSLKLNIIKD